MKRYLVSILLLVISMVCLIIYVIMGQEALLNETTSDPFFLIPLAGLLATVGIVIGIYKGLH